MQVNIYARVTLFEANGNVLRYYSEQCKICEFVRLHSFAGLAYPRRPDPFCSAAPIAFMMQHEVIGAVERKRIWLARRVLAVRNLAGVSPRETGTISIFRGRNLNSLPPTICYIGDCKACD